MPYAHAYNANIARALKASYQKHVNVENAINDNPMPNDVTSQSEGITLKNPEVIGGSGFAASTLQDLGFEPILGAIGEAKPKTAWKKRNAAITAALTGCGVYDRSVGEGVPDCRVVGEGVAGAGVAGAGVAGGLQEQGRSVRKKGGFSL